MRVNVPSCQSKFAVNEVMLNNAIQRKIHFRTCTENVNMKHESILTKFTSLRADSQLSKPNETSNRNIGDILQTTVTQFFQVLCKKRSQSSMKKDLLIS